MRILILSQWFDPEPSFKGLPFARELRRRGHEVSALTGFPNYPGGKIYKGYRIRPWQHESLDGTPILRVPLYPSHDRSAVGRVLNYASFALSASTLGWLLSRKPDVVYAYHPPGTIGLPAVVARRLLGVPVVYDIQDLWPDAVAQSGMLGNKLALGLLTKWCRFVYREADRIVVLSPGFKTTLAARGVCASKIDVIYNWCNEDSLGAAGYSPLPIKAPGEFTVLFAGTMGVMQGLDAVLEAAKICSLKDSRIRFVFIGGGIDRDRLEQNARGIQNVRFFPAQPMSAMGPILAAADVLLVHLKDSPLFKITIPSKTQAYLAAGKPVLMGVRGDAADLVERSGAGLVCEPENPESLARAVLQMAALPPERLAAMGLQARQFYDRELSLKVGVDKFESVFQSLVNNV